jgi:tRNA A37 threonylcarbamoyltransferase TsaD
MIPQNFYDDLYKEGIAPGYFIEKLAKYGDPSEFEVPLALKTATNADFSFTGIKTSV